MSRSFLVSMLAATALLSGNAMAVTAGNTAAMPAKGADVGPAAITTSHKLLKTFVDTANAGGSALPAATHTIVGTTATINCANAAGCTISGEFSAQIRGVAAANAVAVCLYIDGISVDGCPYNGTIPAGSDFYVNSYSSYGTVALGNHTVDMKVYSSQAASLYRWVKEIKLYKP